MTESGAGSRPDHEIGLGTRSRVRSTSFDETLDRQDDVEGVLAQARELVGRVLSSRSEREHLVRQLAGGSAVFHSAADEMIEHAQREILCVLSAADVPQTRRDHTVYLLHRAHRRGVHVEAMVPPALAAALQSRDDHASYRIGNLPNQSLVIVDRRGAALYTDAESEPPQTLIVGTQSLVRFLRSTFDANWNSATPLVDINHVNERLRSQPARSVLLGLRDGEIDEVTARRLGLSVRTYRRYVAEIMRDMRAASRFQAGVRAAELKLLE
jgi:hypothetical protein